MSLVNISAKLWGQFLACWIKLWTLTRRNSSIPYGDFVTNSYGESLDSSCEKSWVPVWYQWVLVNPLRPNIRTLLKIWICLKIGHPNPVIFSKMGDMWASLIGKLKHHLVCFYLILYPMISHLPRKISMVCSMPPLSLVEAPFRVCSSQQT